MLKKILELAKSDGELSRLSEEAREYARIYVLARKRQKGCDGMGELAMVREEFGDIFVRLMNYCKREGYLSGETEYEVDSVADELAGDARAGHPR